MEYWKHDRKSNTSRIKSYRVLSPNRFPVGQQLYDARMTEIMSRCLAGLLSFLTQADALQTWYNELYRAYSFYCHSS